MKTIPIKHNHDVRSTAAQRQRTFLDHPYVTILVGFAALADEILKSLDALGLASTTSFVGSSAMGAHHAQRL